MSLLKASKAALKYCEGTHDELLPDIIRNLKAEIAKFEDSNPVSLQEMPCGDCFFKLTNAGCEPCNDCLTTDNYPFFKESR